MSSGIRRLRVAVKRRESSTITSFELVPEAHQQWRPFQAGQFLVFRLPADNAEGYLLRNYSVSSSPAQSGTYRISVKREDAPRAGLPAGAGSGYLHTRIQVGDLLEADGPRGAFMLDSISTRPVVLLSGGVGLTPMVSMLHALAAQPARRVVFIHACDSGAVHALGDEVRSLARACPHIEVVIVYRYPSDEDRAASRFDVEGVITPSLLQQYLALDDYDFYLCGPPPFMAHVYKTLRGLGVPKPRIAYEFFGPATVLDDDKQALPAGTPREPAAASSDVQSSKQRQSKVTSHPDDSTTAGFSVTFQRNGVSAHWSPTDPPAESLLELAEASGLMPEFSCRAGVCGTCRTGIVSGSVHYFEEPLDDPGEGQVLICCSRPTGDVVLDL